MKMLPSAAALLLVSAAMVARAGVIYNGGAPDHAGGLEADTSSSIGFSQAAESFTLSAGANTIGDVHWWGFCLSLGTTCPTGDFTLFFYQSDAGSPGALIDSYSVGNAGQTATGSTILLFSAEYAYSVSIPHLTLTPGAEYWLGISDTTSTEYSWAWETTSPLGSHAAYSVMSSSWVTSFPGSAAFELTGPSPVPEPGPLALLGGGVLGLLLLRRAGAISRNPPPRR